jgi:hypothetical protein
VDHRFACNPEGRIALSRDAHLLHHQLLHALHQLFASALSPHRALPSPIPSLQQSKLATLCTRAGCERDFVASVA